MNILFFFNYHYCRNYCTVLCVVVENNHFHRNASGNKKKKIYIINKIYYSILNSTMNHIGTKKTIAIFLRKSLDSTQSTVYSHDFSKKIPSIYDAYRVYAMEILPYATQ